MLPKGQWGVKGEVGGLVGTVIELRVWVVNVHVRLCVLLPRAEPPPAARRGGNPGR